MKKLRALIFPLAALALPAAAHAAPVQYQITATHTQETTNGTPIDPSNYFFVDGTTITATFSYDASATAIYTNHPDPTGNGGLSSQYHATSSLSIEVAGYSLSTFVDGPMIIEYDNTSPQHDALVFVSFGNYDQLAFGDFKVTVPYLVISGPSDMLPNQSLPLSLMGLNTSNIAFYFQYWNAGDSSGGGLRTVTFENGTISQVPLPSSALFFLSGLIGLGANVARKLKR